MKKNARKLIAALLALTMALALWPGMAWAADETGDDKAGLSLRDTPEDAIDLKDCEVTLDGENWKVYPLTGKTATLSLSDLNISVRKGDEVVPADKYTLTVQRSWWEGDEEKFETVTGPFGIQNNAEDQENGFTSYQVTAAAVEGSGYRGTTEPRHFLIMDRYSLHYIGASVSFGAAYKVQSQNSWHDRYEIPGDKLAEPTVTAIDGTVLPADTYKLTYFELGSDASDPGKTYAEENPLSGLPTTPGKYFARVDAVKEPYYGTSYVDFDVTTKSVQELSITGLIITKTYTGRAIKQKLVVKDGDTTLELNKHYTLSYKNNTNVTNAGKATVTLKGKVGYTGMVEYAFIILPADIDKPSVTAPANRYYNGKAHTPDVKMTFNQKRLKKDTDYTLTYEKNTNVGTATVTIRGKGSFSGARKVKFKILPPPVVSVPAPPKGTKLTRVTAGKKRFTAKWKKQTSGTTGYQLQYSTSKKFKCGNKTVTIKKNKTTSRKITKLKGKKTYYVRVRTYKTVKGKTYYSAWSKMKAVTTKK